MIKIRFFLIFFCALMLVQDVYAQDREPEDTAKLMNQVRKDKFDIYLADVMRENNIDMWIHVIRPWKTDPLAYEFGSNYGVFIFTDKGDDRIERVVFEGEVRDPSVYDKVGGRSPYINQENYEIMDYRIENPDKPLESDLDLRFLGIKEFVAQRNPKRIGVNYCEKLSLAEGSEVRALTDGISHTDFVQLSKALGKKYSKRIVSAEQLIIDYLDRRTKKEIELHSLMGRRANAYLEAEFAKIIPGKTTLRELRQNVFLREPDGTERHGGDEVPHVLRGGDLLNILYGAGDMTRIMDADVAGHAYILREGETELPEEVKKIWADSMKVREILVKNIKSGVTAGEALEILIEKLEEAGFYYNPRDEYSMDADPLKTQVHLDLHAMGKGVIGPRISPMGSSWHAGTKLPLYHTFTFEYMVHTPVPKWGRGKHLYLCFHDGAMIGENGVEFPYPPAQKIRAIATPGKASLISGINLGTTNTQLDTKGDIVDEFDFRASVRIKEDTGVEVQSVTFVSPSGASITVNRGDEAAIDQRDPRYGIEVIRGFEVDGDTSDWSCSAIANLDYELFGDGTYNIIAKYEGGSECVELWFGEPDSKRPLPFPRNSGFKSPDVYKPMPNRITFEWETDPIAQNTSVYFARGGPTKSDSFPATVTSFGPHEYASGDWELELAISVERKGTVDGVPYTISKGRVYSTEGVVK